MARKLMVAAVILMVFVAAGCSSEKYGSGVSSALTGIKVKDIILDKNYMGKQVTLEGRISSQCGSNGCWFVLQDETGQIFINLAPNNMSIPPRMNRTAKVTGSVYRVQGELQIVAEGVEVR